MELRDAFSRMKSDQALAEKFVEDPEGVLTIMGVDTTKLVIQPVIGAKDPFKTGAVLRRRGPADQRLGITVCGSVGIIICASVGGDVDIDDIIDILTVGPVTQPTVRT